MTGCSRKRLLACRAACLLFCAEQLSKLPISSSQAADVLEHWGVRADAIYIDAAHAFDPAFEDMTKYWPLLKPGGILFGDDAANADVFGAIKKFQRVNAAQISRPYLTAGNAKSTCTSGERSRRCARTSVWSLEKRPSPAARR